MKTFKTKAGTELPLLDLKGKDYLQVAHRIRWMREDHPEWAILTEIIKTDEKASTVKATIANETGRILASAHQTEQEKDFHDHLAKSETAAIGRALALCGYGTQFAPELDEQERIVDSPVFIQAKSGITENMIPTPRKESSGAFCSTCGTEMVKGNLEFYCKNYKDLTNGQHAHFPIAELAIYIKEQDEYSKVKS